jgi:general L-amino acid transport system permease protein
LSVAAPPAKPPVWNDPAWRALFFQVVVVGFVIMVAVFLVRNTINNLERQGIASGFGFLGTTAGFSIGETLIPYHEEHTYGRTFLVGVLNTASHGFPATG